MLLYAFLIPSLNLVRYKTAKTATTVVISKAIYLCWDKHFLAIDLVECAMAVYLERVTAITIIIETTSDRYNKKYPMYTA